jgi:hypothetical protein
MKYKLPDYPNPSLVEIAEENDVEILARMEHDSSHDVYHVAKKINDLLFGCLWTANLNNEYLDLHIWLSIMRRMSKGGATITFKQCFAHSIFEKVYFGANKFDGSMQDMQIIENRNRFVIDYNIQAYCRVKELPYNLRFDHFESYKTTRGEIVVIVSPYTDDVPPEPFVGYHMMYHPNAKTYIAWFESKIEYNKWRKELIHKY